MDESEIGTEFNDQLDKGDGGEGKVKAHIFSLGNQINTGQIRITGKEQVYFGEVEFKIARWRCLVGKTFRLK